MLLKLASNGAAYGTSVALGTIATLFGISVVISEEGATVSGGLAVAQTIGALAAIVIACGWGILGPAAVAGMANADRGRYFINSLTSRSLLLTVLVIPYVILVFALSPPGTSILPNAISGATVLFTALGSDFFFVGIAKPWLLLLFDALPRILGTTAGAAALLATHQVLWFVVPQLLGALLAVVIATVAISRSYPPGVLNLSLRDSVARLKGNSAGLLAASMVGLYVRVPILLVSALAPGGIPAFALIDKLQKFGNAALVPVTQVAQGYVPAADSRIETADRVRRVLQVASLVAIGAGAAFYLAIPTAAGIVSGREIDISTPLRLAFSVILAAIVISGVAALAGLMSLGEARSVAASTTFGTVFGIPLCVLMIMQFGIEGAAWSVAATESSVATYQLVALRRALRRFSSQ